jgi:hypothetical protein
MKYDQYNINNKKQKKAKDRKSERYLKKAR